MSLPPPPLARRRLLLQRMAWVCAVMVLAITSLSAFLRLSKYGLDCDPWPQCYAQAQQDSATGPAANQPSGAEAAARLAHRVIASAALLLVLVMLETQTLRVLAQMVKVLLMVLLQRLSLALILPGQIFQMLV